jgi:hypothetical protein
MSRCFSVVVACLIGLAVAVPAAAQADSPLGYRDPFDKITKDSAIVRIQLQLGLSEERRALQLLSEAGGPADVVDLESIIHAGYVKFRFAENSMQLRMATGTKYPDPLLQYVNDKLNLAMHHVREAGLASKAAAAGDWPKVAVAMQNLELAISIAEQVALLY